MDGAGGCRVIDLSAGASHSACLVDCGPERIVVTFGRGEDGQLGHGVSEEVWAPQAIASLLHEQELSSVHCGAEYTIAVSQQSGAVYSWGWGDFGRLGHGDSSDLFIPKPISFFQGMRIKQVACGDSHTLVVGANGELFAFGRNQNGQLGLGHTDDMLSPQLVEALQGQEVVSVSAGAEHSLAATGTGEVYGWGWGRYGNLGDGHQQDRLVPTRAAGLEGAQIVTVNCGWRHSVALSREGQLYTWGWAKYGQLGHQDNQDRLTPTLVQGLQGHAITRAAGGWRHTMAADAAGTLYGWGWNRFGQLGVGDIEDRNAPTPVPKLTGVGIQLLACGWRHTMAMTSSGQVYAWGRGVNGALGIGCGEDKCEPTLVAPLSQGTLDPAAIKATASPAAAYVSPEERYAVVPGGAPDGADAFGDVAVPDVAVPSVQGPGKKPRVAVS